MRLFIIDDDYPNDDNLYGDVFAHVRVKSYQKKHECIVGSLKHKSSYIYEGVNVKAFQSPEEMKAFIDSYAPEIILVHFALKPVINQIILTSSYRFIIWVHGYEALGWYRRLFNLIWRNFMPRNFYNLVRPNVEQLYSFRKMVLASNNDSRIQFVFVSKWMKKICEQDIFARVKHYKIIPNPIDNHLFKPKKKTEECRFHVLMIRPFDSKKYATDIAIKAIHHLKHNPLFSKFSFQIYGRGKKFRDATSSLSTLPNVTLHESFIPQGQIPQIHASAGIFLCPTRQDAQGVSMCEAMCSGLVPITSDNTAIPEFVSDHISGFLTTSAEEIAERLAYLANNPEVFQNMSENTSRHIIEKAGIDSVTEQEMAYMQEISFHTSKV